MFIGLGLMILYSSLIVSIIAFVFYIIVFKQEIDVIFFAELRETAFYAIIVSMIIMSFFTARGFLFAWRQTAINAEKAQREHISSQYEALKNQVNPHFLFNSLNALSSLIYDEPDKAVEFINRLSDVYRYVLDSKDKEAVPEPPPAPPAVEATKESAIAALKDVKKLLSDAKSSGKDIGAAKQEYMAVQPAFNSGDYAKVLEITDKVRGML